MKRISAILLSFIMVFVMTVTNMAGAYNTASRVYAAELNEDAGNIGVPDAPGDNGSVEETETPPAEETVPQEMQTENPVLHENVDVPPVVQEGTPGIPVVMETQIQTFGSEEPVAPDNSDSSLTDGTEPDGNENQQNGNGAGAVPETVTVVFDANGHGTAPAAIEVEKGQAVAKPDDPAADGFTFTGWYMDVNATALWDFSTKVLEAITLYAGWQENAPHTHAFGAEWKYDDTKHWHECTANDGEKSDEGAHGFGEWTTVKEATETETGSKERVCSVCGYAEKEEIPVIQNKVPRLRNGDPIPIEAPVETGITLIDDGANAKKVYYDGEPLDLTGLSLRVDWGDGSQTTYQVKAENVHGFDSSKMGPQTLRITYGLSLHVYFDIEVKPLATTPTLTPPTITRQGNTVLISSPSPGTIGYTLDGKDPVYWNNKLQRWNFNGNAAWESYTVPFELGYGTTTVMAAVRADGGSNASPIATATFERSLPRVRVFDQDNGDEYKDGQSYNLDNATFRLEGEAGALIYYSCAGDPVSYDSESGRYKVNDGASLYTAPFQRTDSGTLLSVRQMLPDGSHVSASTSLYIIGSNESPSGQASVTLTVVPYNSGCEIRADYGDTASQVPQQVIHPDKGMRVSLTAKPATGYRFLAWVENGTVLSTNDIMRFYADGDRRIVAHFTTTNSTGFSVSWNGGSAYSIKGGSSGNYRVSGTENVAAGGSFAFSVNPHSGYRKTDSFRVLAGNTPLSLNAQGNYVINPVYQDTTITVEGLEQEPGQTYETKVIAGTGGYARVNGVESVTTPGGTKVTLTAFPDEGYRFLYWTSLPSYVTEAETKTNPLVYTVNQNATVIRPVFGRVEQTYLVSASGDGHGQVTASPAAGTEGTKVTLRVTPDRGWRVKDWTVVEGGVTVEKLTANTARLTIGSADISVRANFEPVPGFVYDVAVTATPTGWGTVSASHSSGTAGTEVKLTATPDRLMQFARWEVIKGGVTLSDATAATATFTIGTSDVEIRAVFEDTPITVATNVTVTTDGNGQASANPYGDMARGTKVTLSATPNTGYKFKEWEITTITGDDQSNPVTLSDKTDTNATFNANARNIQIKAHFEQVPATSITITLTNNDATATAPEWVTGDKGKAVATVSPAGALQDVTWSSSNPQAVTIDQNGNIEIVYDMATNLRPRVTITATAKDGSGVTATKDITVSSHFHTVTFRPEGGSGSMAVTAIGSNDNDVAVYDSGRSKAYTLPDCRFIAPAGKAFKAWRVNGAEHRPGDTITLSGRCSRTDVYAVWEDAQVYRITVQTTGNGKAEARANQSVGQGSETVQSALQGTAIFTRANPDNGYAVGAATYSWYDGNTLREESLINPLITGLSSFRMPAADVTIKVTFVPGGPRLTDLSVSPGTLSPAFDKDILAYDVTVAHNVSEIQATVTYPEYTGADGGTWTLQSSDTANGRKAFSHALDYGINKLQLLVYNTASGRGTYYDLNVTREPAPGAPKITTASLPDGEERKPYTTTTLSADNAKNATWSLGSGDLPAGLSLSADGKISGTPTRAGTYSFIVKAENAAGYDTKEFTITVNPAPVPRYTVRYRVINGTWDGTNASEKTEQVESGNTPANVPTGMKPDNGYEGGTWDTDPVGVTITTDRTFAYSFTAKPVTPTASYAVDVSVETTQSGWGSVSGAGSYHENADAAVTAKANTGYKFVCWKENGTPVSTDENYTFKVTKDRNLVAEFVEDGTTPTPQPATQYSVAVTATHGGTVTGGGMFNENASVTVEAKPDAGYRFKQWTENGAKVGGADASYTFTLTADRTLIAEFELIPLSITGVTISPAKADVIKGGSQQFTAMVTGTGAYSSAVTWSVNGNQSGGTKISADGLLTVGADETATTLTVTVTSTEDTAKKVSATVTVKEKQPNTCTVTFDSDGGNAVASQQVAVNGTATKPADPTKNGYTFDGWYLNGAAYDFTTPVTKDILLTAKWTQLPSTERRVDIRGFSDADIPQSLKNAGYDTTAKIQNALLQAVINKNGSAYGSNYALYEVTLMVSFDGGVTWVVATPENFPTGGITVTLPYPAGTGRTTHNFSVAHMFTVAMRGHLPGQMETPPVTKTANGIQVTLDGLSPVLVSWTEVTNSSPSKPSQPTSPTNPTNPVNPSQPTNPTNPVNPSQPSNPGTSNNNGTTNHATNNTETAGIMAVINGDLPTATQTGTTTARSTTGQQAQNARMSQTGDDLYERLGIHTMTFLLVLTVLLASLRKTAEEKGMISRRRLRR